MPKAIGLIGTGNMGFAIAENLIKAGYSLVVYNRTFEKAKPLLDRGAREAKTPSEVAEAGGIAITMVSDDSALNEITLSGGLMEKLGKDGIHISMSTVSPFTSRELACKHRGIGAYYVSAPVFGRPEHARESKLWICIAGDASAKERAKPILKPLSQGIYDFGEDVGYANLVKLLGNFMICAVKEQLAEVFAIGMKFGISPGILADFYTSTLFPAPIYKRYSDLIIDRAFEPAGFRLALGLKDMNLLTETAQSASVRMPFLNVIHERLQTAIEKGRADLDWSALALGAFEDAELS